MNPLHPIAWPQLAALFVTGIGFFLAVIVKRFASRAASESGARRDLKSIAGIALQSIGFGLAAVGPVIVTRPADDPQSIVAAAATALFGGGAAWLFTTSARAMGANWSLVARTRTDHQLVRHGPFARVRHPIYAAMLMFLGALAIGLGHYEQFAIAVPVFLAGTLIRIRIEERLLRRQFGEVYDEYARTTPALIPLP